MTLQLHCKRSYCHWNTLGWLDINPYNTIAHFHRAFTLFASLATRSSVVHRRWTHDNASTFAFTTNLSNLQSKINQSEPNWNDLLDHCWLEYISFYGKRYEKRHSWKESNIFSKGVGCCIQLQTVLTKKRVPRDQPPTYVKFTDGILCAHYKDMNASWWPWGRTENRNSVFVTYAELAHIFVATAHALVATMLSFWWIESIL